MSDKVDVPEAVETTDRALRQISAIRDSIVAHQSINWSAHIYPLVEALKAAGYSGLGYDEAVEKFVGTVKPGDGSYDRLGDVLRAEGLSTNLGSGVMEPKGSPKYEAGFRAGSEQERQRIREGAAVYELASTIGRARVHLDAGSPALARRELNGAAEAMGWLRSALDSLEDSE